VVLIDFSKLLRVLNQAQISVAVGSRRNTIRTRKNDAIRLKFSCWTDENRYGTVNKLRCSEQDYSKQQQQPGQSWATRRQRACGKVKQECENGTTASD
jgi:hypothetical protein